MKKLISLTMSLIMTFTAVAPSITAHAEEQPTTSQIPYVDNNITVSGTNSFGNMLSKVLTEEQTEVEENNGFNVFSIDIEGKTATAEYEAQEDCTLVAAIYDEDGNALLATGSVDVVAGETSATFEIDTETMPQYFYLRGFLIDPDTLRPKCTVYESPMYTQEMQEFLAKTTDDFDENLVLSLDGSKDNNFAVFAEGTKQIKTSETVNTFVTWDEATDTYTFANADSSLTGLAVGDVFAFKNGNEVVIEKVGAITVDGTDVVIVADDAEIEEAFDYVKISASQDSKDAVTDNSVTDSCLSPIETVTPVNAGSNIASPIVDNYVNAYKFNEKETNKEFGMSIKGFVGLNAKLEADYKLSLSYCYVEIKINYELGASVSVGGKLNKKFSLANIGFSPVAGLYVDIEPKLVLQTEAKFELSATLSGTIGFRADFDNGITNISTTPVLKVGASGEVSAFIGIEIAPKVSIVHEILATVSLSGTLGVTITAYATSGYLEALGGYTHGCESCISGSVTPTAIISAEAKFISSDSLTFKLGPKTIKGHNVDFYLSSTYGTMGFTKCPYIFCKGVITVADVFGSPIIGATVIDPTTNEEYITDENGRINITLQNGTRSLVAKKDGYIMASKTFKVKSEKVKQTITLRFDPSSSVGTTTGNYDSAYDVDREVDGKLDNTVGNLKDWVVNDGAVKFKAVGSGYYHSAAIAENGDLYMWGSNTRGQLGYGDNAVLKVNADSEEYSDIPIKVLSNVKEVELGLDTSAAITENGDLYMWGNNYLGQLGDGTGINRDIPIKIMSNIKAVSLGNQHSAAITENGDLYIWGDNYRGQLGKGDSGRFYEDLTPVKIMSNVKTVSLGFFYSAAITENGDLYTWGWNEYFCGSDTTDDTCYFPNKLMSDVKAVSIGLRHCALIKENGDLYTWGYDYYGQNTSEYLLIPEKVMSNVKVVSLGISHSAAITDSSDLYTWGDNSYGELGDGDVGYYYYGILWKIMSNVKSVSLGLNHNAVITENGALYTWGYNCYGQLGDGTTEERYTPTLIKVYPSNDDTVPITNSTSTIASKTISYKNLTPSTEHNFYVLKSNEAKNILAPENILYVTQKFSDESGNLTIDFTPAENFESAYVYLKSIEYIPISETEITVLEQESDGTEKTPAPELKYNGKSLIMGRDFYVSGDILKAEAGTYNITIHGTGDFTGEVSASWTIVPKQETPVEQFVERLYTIMLNRNSDEGKQSHVIGLLGGKTAAEIAKGFVLGEELKVWNISNEEFVRRMYLTFLDREADAEGLAVWTSVLDKGCSYGRMFRDFCNSAEFKIICDSYGIKQGSFEVTEPRDINENITHYCSRMYTKALGRAYDVDGLNIWTEALINGTETPESIAVTFLDGDEFRMWNHSDEVFVDRLYETLFNRPADAEGKQTWLNLLALGTSRKTAIETFVQSPEFILLKQSLGL